MKDSIPENLKNLIDEHNYFEQPEDDEFTAFRDRMVACSIKPIWYPNKEYHLVDDLLSLLKI